MIVDGVFVLIIAVLAGAVIHYRAKANAAATSASINSQQVASISTSLATELETLRGDVRAMVDSKFNALGKWLLSEVQKMIDATAAPSAAPAPDPAAPAAPNAAATPPADAAATPSAEPPLTGGDGTDFIAQVDATVKALLEKKAKVEAAQQALRDALAG